MRAVIVDDNEIDRLNLRTLLAEHATVEVVGEADAAASAVALIDREKPDVVFLDIRLGSDDGFKVLEHARNRPRVVITTAYPHYALKGFEIDAVDYLLKPIMDDALARTVRRLTAQGEGASGSGRLEPEDVQLFREPDGFHVVPVGHILAVTGERVYSRVLVIGGREYLHNRTLREWRELLPVRLFRVLDRSTIVNLREVKSVTAEPAGAGSRMSFRNCTQTIEIGAVAMRAFRGLG